MGAMDRWAVRSSKPAHYYTGLAAQYLLLSRKQFWAKAGPGATTTVPGCGAWKSQQRLVCTVRRRGSWPGSQDFLSNQLKAL